MNADDGPRHWGRGVRICERRADNSDTYLVLAHLKDGSVNVATGDVVDVGDHLGQAGNSGHQL